MINWLEGGSWTGSAAMSCWSCMSAAPKWCVASVSSSYKLQFGQRVESAGYSKRRTQQRHPNTKLARHRYTEHMVFRDQGVSILKERQGVHQKAAFLQAIPPIELSKAVQHFSSWPLQSVASMQIERFDVGLHHFFFAWHRQSSDSWAVAFNEATVKSSLSTSTCHIIREDASLCF